MGDSEKIMWSGTKSVHADFRVSNPLASLGQCRCSVAPSAPHGCLAFVKVWSQETGSRCLESLCGEREDTVLICHKSVKQLQEFHDYLKQLEQETLHVGSQEEEQS